MRSWAALLYSTYCDGDGRNCDLTRDDPPHIGFGGHQPVRRPADTESAGLCRARTELFRRRDPADVRPGATAAPRSHIPSVQPSPEMKRSRVVRLGKSAPSAAGLTPPSQKNHTQEAQG